VDLYGNRLRSIGSIFDGFTASGYVRLGVASNELTADAVRSAVNSYSSSVAVLTLDFSFNHVTELPGGVFSNLLADTPGHGDITLNLSWNPLQSISPTAFVGSHSYIRSILLDLSHPTAGPLMAPLQPFNFSGIRWHGPPGSGLGVRIYVVLTNTNVDLSIVRALSHDPRGPNGVLLDLSYNNYTVVPAGVFNSSRCVRFLVCFLHGWLLRGLSHMCARVQERAKIICVCVRVREKLCVCVCVCVCVCACACVS
jgi:hypothetical protein